MNNDAKEQAFREIGKRPKKHAVLNWIVILFIVSMTLIEVIESATPEIARVTFAFFIVAIMLGWIYDFKFNYVIYDEYMKKYNNIISTNEIIFKNKFDDYISRNSIPEEKVIITCLDFNNYKGIKTNNIQVIIWKEDNRIYLVHDDIYSNLNRIEIPVENIKSFNRFGDIHSYANITGGSGGGSSISGAVVGGVIAGGAGAVIGSRKKTEAIKTENIIVDKRQTIVEIKDNNNMYYLVFTSEDYDVFLKIIPSKEKSFVKNDTSSNESIYRDIEELAKLREKNILTLEEFDNKKKQLLEKIN